MGFEPSNELENALVKASGEADARPEFYRILKLSDIYVIGNGAVPDECGLVRAGDTISIQNAEIDGKLYLAVFTSEKQLCRTINAETNYYRLKFDDLLNLVGDVEIVINPYLEYGKILSTTEVQGLRDGSIWSPQNKIVIEENTQVMIGNPQKQPIELIEALKKYFGSIDKIGAAYNVHYFNPKLDQNPHTLICIEGTERTDRIAAEIGMICNSVTVPDPPVDVIFINTNDSFGKSITGSFEPFYKKKKKIFGVL